MLATMTGWLAQCKMVGCIASAMADILVKYDPPLGPPLIAFQYVAWDTGGCTMILGGGVQGCSQEAALSGGVLRLCSKWLVCPQFE